jgi:hypothetical protein
MDFLKSLLPVEWSMRLFEPETDTVPGAAIYLHISETDAVYRLKKDVSRYQVVELLKDMHDGEIAEPDLPNKLSELFIINFVGKIDTERLMSIFRPFLKAEAIFAGQTELIIEHDKDEQGNWITSFIKKFDKAKRLYDEKPIAVLCNNPEFNFA